MIKQITLCFNHAVRVRKLGLDRPGIRFEPGYNVLIGPNGSGKSTVLAALASCPLCHLEKSSDADAVKYVTTETLNPLIGGYFSTREEMVQGIRSMFKSHGQGVLDSLGRQSHGTETVVLIDSPETGQDHENSEYIHQGLLQMAKRYQVIVATNSLVFMRGGNLIDLGRQSLRRLVASTEKMLAEFDASGQKASLKHRTDPLRAWDNTGWA
ncbi:MAG: AAA family ATPase [Candidatus Hydrogenedentes bacterium]|nr:AAA family ATPase [Candidatus Hydrogenedentota bacterium]